MTNVNHYKTWDEPKDDQRRPLQKPGMNLNITNVDHYKNLIPGFCSCRRWSSLGSFQVFVVVDVGHLKVHPKFL
jgi:hypothetical protein